MLTQTNGKPERVAIYARVSSEDQAERHTVHGQLDFLRNFSQLYSLPVAAEYVDDGISGTVPLHERPEGRRLLEGAEAGQFTTVLLYRLDRLGRSLSALLEANGALDRHGVTIRSATEPFDTSTPVGRFVFQLLGSIAELEKATIIERTTLGRDRVARTGRWTGGRIPFGYDLDANGHLTPSERMVPELGMTEADVVRDLFRRVAEGSGATAEARRLNAAGLRPTCRYRDKEIMASETWGMTTVFFMLKNPCYKGCAVVRSKAGVVERPVPALVTPEVWEQASRQLTKNCKLATRNAKRLYLLRGLVVCGNCGRRMTGQVGSTKGASSYYRCMPAKDRTRPDGSKTCRAKHIRAEWLESLVWEDCKRFIYEPGDALDEAQRQLRARLERAAGLESQQRALLQQIGEKEAERERVMTLFRRGRITLEEAERHMDDITRETATLRETVDALRSQARLAEAYEAHLSQAGALLSQLRDRLEEVERTNDWETKRQIVELLVTGITVNTLEDEPHRRRRAEVTVHYNFGQPSVVDSRTPHPSEL